MRGESQSPVVRKEGQTRQTHPTVRPMATSTRLSAVWKPLDHTVESLVDCVQSVKPPLPSGVHVHVLVSLVSSANLSRPPLLRPDGSWTRTLCGWTSVRRLDLERGWGEGWRRREGNAPRHHDDEGRPACELAVEVAEETDSE